MAVAMEKIKCCLLFSTADWDAQYWTNKQYTAKQLSQNGFSVLYVESVGLRPPKIGSSKDWKRIFRRLKLGIKGPRVVEKDIWVLSPLLLPFLHKNKIVSLFNQVILSFLVKRFIYKNNFKNPIIWSYHPYILRLVEHIKNEMVIYHCVDDLKSVPGIDGSAFRTLEKIFLKRADYVFTTSQALELECSKYNHNTHYFSNVVDQVHFNSAFFTASLPVELEKIPCPRLGYIGVLSDFKIDFPLLFELAMKNPKWNFILIGDEREGQNNLLLKKMRKINNIHFLGHRDYNLLPSYLAGFDVGLLPTLINDYTKYMFPMKYYEYLAAGLPVVSTALDFTRYVQDGLEKGNDAETFSKAIAKQLSRGKLKFEESKIYVGDNTWSKRMDKMLEIIGK